MHLLTHALTHSLTHSLTTHSLTHILTHTLTHHSLTHTHWQQINEAGFKAHKSITNSEVWHLRKKTLSKLLTKLWGHSVSLFLLSALSINDLLTTTGVACQLKSIVKNSMTYLVLRCVEKKNPTGFMLLYQSQWVRLLFGNLLLNVIARRLLIVISYIQYICKAETATLLVRTKHYQAIL